MKRYEISIEQPQFKKEVKLELLRGYCFASRFESGICDRFSNDVGPLAKLQWTLFDFQADHPVNCSKYDCEKMQAERFAEIGRTGFEVEEKLLIV